MAAHAPDLENGTWSLSPLSHIRATTPWLSLSPDSPFTSPPCPVPYGGYPWTRTHFGVSWPTPLPPFVDGHDIISRLLERDDLASGYVDTITLGGTTHVSLRTAEDVACWLAALQPLVAARELRDVSPSTAGSPRILPCNLMGFEIGTDRAMAYLSAHLRHLCSLEESASRLTCAGPLLLPSVFPSDALPPGVFSVIMIDSLFTGEDPSEETLANIRSAVVGSEDPPIFIYATLRRTPTPLATARFTTQIACSIVEKDEAIKRWSLRTLRADSDAKQRIAYIELLLARCAYLSRIDWDTRDMKIVEGGLGRTQHARRLAELMPQSAGGDHSPYRSDEQTREYEAQFLAARSEATSMFHSQPINFSAVEGATRDRYYYIRVNLCVHRVGYNFSLLNPTSEYSNLVPNFLRILTVERGHNPDGADRATFGITSDEQYEMVEFIDMRAMPAEPGPWLAITAGRIEMALRKRQEQLLAMGCMPSASGDILETQSALYQQASECARGITEELRMWTLVDARFKRLPNGLMLTAASIANRRIMGDQCAAHQARVNQNIKVLYELLGVLHITPPDAFAESTLLMSMTPIPLLQQFMFWVEGVLRDGLCDPALLNLQYIVTRHVMILVSDSTQHFGEMAVELWATVFHRGYGWNSLAITATWHELFRSTQTQMIRLCTEAYEAYQDARPSLDQWASKLASMKSFRAIGHEGPILDRARSSLRERVQNMTTMAELLRRDATLTDLAYIEDMLLNGDTSAWVTQYCGTRTRSLGGGGGGCGGGGGGCGGGDEYDWRMEDNHAIAERLILHVDYVGLVMSSQSIVAFARAATPATATLNSFLICGAPHIIRDAVTNGCGGLLISPTLETVDEVHSVVWLAEQSVLSGVQTSFPPGKNEWVQTVLDEHGDISSWPYRRAEGENVLPPNRDFRTGLLAFRVPWTYRTAAEEHATEISWVAWTSESDNVPFASYDTTNAGRADAFVFFAFRLRPEVAHAADMIYPRLAETLRALAINVARFQRENRVTSFTVLSPTKKTEAPFVAELLRVLHDTELQCSEGGQVRCLEVL